MTNAEKYLDLPLEDIIGDRFGRYSKYIIQERALPDARDGLKPVQRRILYAMYQDGNVSDKPFRKSAKTVGNVIGNYHPHGDTSVYDAMVRLSQDWKVRNVLVEMHGNNGSIDGDPPAAMRYTEARLSPIASELLRDIDKKTVDFTPNFDDTQEEPVVLPALFPSLLVNGSTGISSGYATEIPPHHLGEVIDAVTMQIDKPESTVDELMTVIKGPDFPTGGIIQGVDGIKQAYETGKGKIVIRAKTEIEDQRGGRQQIVITEIPYEVNKANLVKRMDELRIDKKVDGISEVRDETDRTGLRIVIELKKEADSQGVLNYLFKNTDLQISYNFNMVAIHNRTPQLMGLKKLIDAYIQHQREVVTNRSKYELKKAQDRQHVVEGLIKAISILDEVIATIRASKDKKDAKNNLIDQYAFTEAQAEAIVTLQLYRLTNTDIKTLEKEAEELEKQIKELLAILNSERKLLSVIKKELARVKKTYADNRRSVIEAEIQEIKINLEVMIPSEDVVISVTREGYVKRTSPRSYSASNGEPPGMKDTDRVLKIFNGNTTNTMLVFTNKGNYLHIPVHELPDIRWKDAGQHVTNIVSIDRDETVVDAMVVEEFKADEYLLFFTKNGMVKRTELSNYKAQRYSKPLMALKLKKEDELVDVFVTDGKKEIFIATHKGYGLWYEEEEVSVVGQRAAGVKAINLKDDDQVVSGFVKDKDERTEVVVVTNRGAVKKMRLENEFERTSRAKRGVVMLRELKSNPHRIVKAIPLNEESLVWIEAEKGKEEVIDPTHLRPADRYNNGSFIIDVTTEGPIVDAWKRKKEEE
ncbi:DNA topoisomerase IV subunit A [Alkalihalobacillus sp. TS-13]|uniref:DNA topoisomerase IV subunit A n=1 Tax=Alkalihalobacillus sp. TS-13 TaxID=2842455 RepID=UPI001C86CD7C|nr:DNA topoisomerase IV subunit A [Alkalihalobacillus sp. TS-13]